MQDGTLRSSDVFIEMAVLNNYRHYIYNFKYVVAKCEVH